MARREQREAIWRARSSWQRPFAAGLHPKYALFPFMSLYLSKTPERKVINQRRTKFFFLLSSDEKSHGKKNETRRQRIERNSKRRPGQTQAILSDLCLKVIKSRTLHSLDIMVDIGGRIFPKKGRVQISVALIGAIWCTSNFMQIGKKNLMLSRDYSTHVPYPSIFAEEFLAFRTAGAPIVTSEIIVCFV